MKNKRDEWLWLKYHAILVAKCAAICALNSAIRSREWKF